MSLPKNFLHEDIKSIGLNKSIIISGIVIGLFSAFAFYSVFYTVREVLRILSTTENYDAWLLSKAELNFYNLFYAFLSVIFGQSICFSFWLTKKRKPLKRHNHFRTSIIVDQSVLNFYFLLWFSKLALMFVVFFGLDRSGGFYAFSFYPEYNYLFILIIAVLFLQSWVTIRRIFKNKSLKWMIISVMAVSSLAFTLSKINIVDYKSINESLLNNNIYHKYNLQIPVSDVYERLENQSLVESIYLVKAKNQTKKLLLAENKIINLNALDTIIANWRYDKDDFDIPRMTYQLHIDNDIDMVDFNELRIKLSSLGVSKIAYSVVPKNHEYDKRYYRNYVLSVRIPFVRIFQESQAPPPPQVSLMQPGDYENIILLDIPENNKFLIKGQIVKKNELKGILKELISQNHDYIVDLSTGKDVNFANYFKALSSYKKAINELREEYASNKYSTEFQDLDEGRRWLVIDKYPLRLYEQFFENEHQKHNQR